MADRYTRRINLYINDKEVRNDIASIRKEMMKMTAAQNRMVIGSREYIAEGRKIAALRAIIKQHNDDLQQTSKSVFNLGKVADAFNKYFALVTAAVAAFTGVAMVIKSTVDAFAEFDDKLVDVMKTTDLTKKQTKELNKELKKIDTRTAQLDLLNLARIAGKLGIKGKEDILGFVRATDKISVSLSEDLGGDTEESVRQLGKLVDIFKLTNEYSMEDSLIKIGSAMNALGASGTANEAYLLEFTKRVAGVAPSAGISIDKILGLATTLDELGQSSEVAATAYNQVISKMFKDTETYANIAGMSLEDFTNLMNTDTNEAMIQLLIGAKGTAGGFGELTNSLSELGMDGVRATTVLGALAANIDKLRENQKFSNEEFIKGTSLLIEYNKKNSSAQAMLEKAAKRFKEIQVELGEKLTPIYASTIHKASTLLKIFGATVEFLFKYGSTIVLATGYLLAYAAAVKLTALWEARKNTAFGIGLALERVGIALHRAGSAAMLLYSAAVALFTGNLARARAAWGLFIAFSGATGIGAVFIALGALIVAIKSYDKYSAAAVEREKLRVDSLKGLKKANDDYTASLQTLSDTIKLTQTKTREEKQSMSDLADETIRAAEASLILQKSKQQELKESASVLTTWQKFVVLLKGANVLDIENDPLYLEKALQNGKEAAAEMDDGISDLLSTINSLKDGSKGLKDILNAESIGDAIGSESIVMMQEKLTKYKVALDNAIFGGEDYIRIQKKIQDVEKKMGTADKSLSEDQITRESDILEAAFNKKQALIRQNFLEQKISEDEYNSQLLVSELKFLDDKLKIYKVGSKEYQETLNKSLEIQATAKQRIDDLSLKALEVLNDAKIENLKDGLEKELALQERAWEKEKASLEKQLIDKQILTQQEVEFNDSIYRTIEEKEILHQQKMADIKNASKIGTLENLVEAAEPVSEEFVNFDQLQAHFDAKQELLKAQYERELELANGNHAAILAAEARFNRASLQNKNALVDAEYDLILTKIDNYQGYLTQLAGVFSEESAMGKALFLFQQGLAIAEIWVNVAKANMKAVNASPLTFGQPWVTANTVQGGINTALVLAQTVGHLAKFATGGYTDGERIYIAGEKGTEWIAPNWMMENPTTAAVIQSLENMRKNKVSVNTSAIPQMASGGFSSKNNAPDALLNPFDKSGNQDFQNQILRDLTNEIYLLRQYRPTVAVETIEKERTKYIEIKQTSGL